MMSDQPNAYENIPLDTVRAALSGSEDGITAAILYYERYITAFCTMQVRDLYDEYMYSFVDDELRQLMRIAVVRATVEFAAKL
jgi:hypothetical protein